MQTIQPNIILGACHTRKYAACESACLCLCVHARVSNSIHVYIPISSILRQTYIVRCPVLWTVLGCRKCHECDDTVPTHSIIHSGKSELIDQHCIKCGFLICYFVEIVIKSCSANAIYTPMLGVASSMFIVPAKMALMCCYFTPICVIENLSVAPLPSCTTYIVYT